MKQTPQSMALVWASLVPFTLLAAGCATASSSSRGAQPLGQSAATSKPEEEFEPESGPFVGVSYVQNSIEGDFDGDTILVGSQDIILVPEIDSGFGPQFVLGFRANNVAIELSYTKTSHNFDFLGAKGDAEFASIDLNSRFFIPTPLERVRPNVLVGFGFPWLDLEDASASTVEVGDAHFSGLGLNLGAGLDYCLTRHWSVGFTGTYRWSLFSSAEGAAGDSGTLDEALYSSGWSFGLGTTWTF